MPNEAGSRLAEFAELWELNRDGAMDPLSPPGQLGCDACLACPGQGKFVRNASLEVTLGWLALQKETTSPIRIHFTHQAADTPILKNLAVHLHQ